MPDPVHRLGQVPAAGTGAGAGGAPSVEAGLAPSSLDDAYAHYTAATRTLGSDARPMSADDFERYTLGSVWLGSASLRSDWVTGWRQVAKRVVQTCRLVVGIHDYEYYLDHMRSRHPEATPLSREAFYRYCLEARYPGPGRSGGRCPC